MFLAAVPGNVDEEEEEEEAEEDGAVVVDGKEEEEVAARGAGWEERPELSPARKGAFSLEGWRTASPERNPPRATRSLCA